MMKEEAGREAQAVWRCAIGDAVGALDVLKGQWLGSRRKHEREAGAKLAEVLDLVWAARGPAPTNYRKATDSGNQLLIRVRAHLQEPRP
jgi:hypothetical protein